MVVLYLWVLYFLLNNLIIVTSELLHHKKGDCDPNKKEECRSNFRRTNAHNRKCEPNKFIYIDCNVCRCGFNGKVDDKQCTQYKCFNGEKSRRLGYVTECEPKHWYQLSQCHLCFCVNKHKLICNTKNISERVVLGEYKMHHCGEKLVQFLMDIIPPEDGLLRSATKKVRSRTILNYENKIKAKSEDSSTQISIYLSPDKSKNFYKFKDVTDIDAKVRFRNSDENIKGFIENNLGGENNDDDNISDLLIDSIEFNFTDILYPFIKVKANNFDNDYLPNVLDKLLRVAIRKSMVTITSGNNCTPGKTVKHQCNTCFCLTNGKTLCTKKDCNKIG